MCHSAHAKASQAPNAASKDLDDLPLPQFIYHTKEKLDPLPLLAALQLVKVSGTNTSIQ